MPIKMAKGRRGLYLEAWKFGVYLLIPISATWYFGDPNRQKRHAEYWSYVEYPANPNVGLAEQVKELQKKQAQREVYKHQLQQLGQQAKRTAELASEANANTTYNAEGGDPRSTEQQSRARWRRWVGL
jgi:Pet100